MQVKLEKTVPVEAPADAAWQFLQDIRAVAACMPGAEITEQVDESHYKGKVKVKLGPATAAFNGDIEVKGVDADKRELHILGKGADVKGTSSASMDLLASVRETDAGVSELIGISQVAVTGKMASFGGRMMTQVSDQIMKQFAVNFANQVVATGEGEAAETAAAKVSEQPKELNALALAWATLVGFFKSLFGGSSSKPAG
ncbi:MAG: SRPBCC family protein [Gammaproteobacteria bacterium]|nr:SRPBCC family protein [Gammaproteobacteria bacterium]MDJ0889984.1 SRPBCC family protein [Gammaproteobacteria bacterium]